MIRVRFSLLRGRRAVRRALHRILQLPVDDVRRPPWSTGRSARAPQCESCLSRARFLSAFPQRAPRPCPQIGWAVRGAEPTAGRTESESNTEPTPPELIRHLRPERAAQTLEARVHGRGGVRGRGQVPGSSLGGLPQGLRPPDRACRRRVIVGCTYDMSGPEQQLTHPRSKNRLC